MAVRRTLMKTSLMPNSGMGTSSSHKPSASFFFTSAFIVFMPGLPLEIPLWWSVINYSRIKISYLQEHNPLYRIRRTLGREMPKNNIIDPLSRLLCEKVKTLRKSQDWTLEELSAASGVSRSMLSQIERGKANPTLAVACRIAHAFGITIGELVEEPWSGSSIKVIRHDDPTHLYRTDSQCRIRTLHHSIQRKQSNFTNWPSVRKRNCEARPILMVRGSF